MNDSDYTMTNPREKMNPDKKPLEELAILVSEDGIQKKIPALSPHFSGDRPMVSFFVPPAMNENGSFPIGAKGEWFHKMEIFTANLQWLLALPHHRFWSQIVYGKKTWDSIISFLQEAYPFFAVHNLPDDSEIRLRYNEISHLVFCVICRVTTQIESEDAWIGKAKFSDLLYNNTIISLPILFDICVVFGNHNKDEVNHIISNIFSLQPLYKDDLDSSVQHLKNVLNSIEERFSMSVVKVDTLSSNKKMSISELYDITFYVLDIAATLFSFIDAYPEGAMILHLHRFEVSLAQFYEKVFPTVIKFMQELFGEKTMPYESLLFTINQARIYFIKLFYLVIESSLNVIIENRTTFPEELLKYNTESFLNVIKESLASKIFIVDYEKMYPLEQDLSILSQVCLDANKGECDSVLELLRANSICINKTRPEVVDVHKNENGSALEVENRSEAEVSDGVNLSDVEKDSLITEVKDILPHLGEGFIMKCLEHYNFKSSDVINAVLENLLPEGLQELDHSLPIIPPEPGTSGKPDVIAHRVNVFDNDEFDIMSRDHIDTSKIHKGKRKDAKDVKEILDDKSFREELRTKFTELGIVETFDNVYEDEYDDTYDDIVDPIEQEGEDERKFVTPRVLQQLERYTKGKQQEEESGEEEEPEPASGTSRDRKFVPFVENPEIIRSRREAKFRGGHSQRNVVGQPKGHGQDADVLKNRHKKTVHKSAQGNHNRKRGAQFKRSQGFIPS